MITPNNIYLGNCLELMSDIPTESIDAIICDLPYNTTNKTNPGAQWDCLIPFEPLWKQYKRIIKHNGAIVLFGQGLFTAHLITSNERMFKYNLIWAKNHPTGFLNANRMPLRNHEVISVFYKQLPTYNPQMTPIKPFKRAAYNANLTGGGGKDKSNIYGSCYENNTIVTVSQKYPTSIISIDKTFNKKFHHPSQKPVELLRYLIRTYTNTGDTVLDNAMGSGSTIIACLDEQRRYIGIEKDPHFFQLAKQRIQEHKLNNK